MRCAERLLTAATTTSSQRNDDEYLDAALHKPMAQTDTGKERINAKEMECHIPAVLCFAGWRVEFTPPYERSATRSGFVDVR